jgi:hypothetical protein
MRTSIKIAAAAALSTVAIAGPAAAALASYSTDFDGVAINDGSGWRMSGPFDAAITDGSLRISNAVTSGSFGNQLFSPELAVPATEGGTATTFEAKFTLLPTEYQEGLRVTVSPDNGSGGRAGFLVVEHTEGGITLKTSGSYFRPAEAGETPDMPNGTVLDWDEAIVASGLDANRAHTVQVKLIKKPNTKKSSNNDVFSVKVDGKPVRNTTFEAYYQATGEANYETDTLLFRLSGTAQPSLRGEGLRIDNLSIATS